MSGVPKNSNDLANEAKKGGKHSNRRAKHKGRPCPNPPSAPTGVAITFKVREKKTHLEFSGKIRWNGVFTDEQGHKIPGGGVEIDHYEGQYWPVDSNGNPIETEDGHARVRRFHKKSVKGLKVINATMISGVTAEFTTKKAHNFVIGEIVRVQDVKPSQYNGKWTVLSAGLTSTKFRVTLDVAATKDLEDEGTVEGQPDPNYNIVIEHFPNPKRWYWVVRIRAWDNKQCPSDWSNVTQPALPIQEAEPQPPAPTFVSLTFDRKGGKKHNAWRGKVKITPVHFWDIPGGDHEDDMAVYWAKIQVSEDGGNTWDKHALLHVRDSDEEKDEDASILMVFGRVRRRNLYRVLLSSTSRYHQRGDYAGPYPSPSGFGVGFAPGQVQNVVVTRPAPRRLKASWDEPASSATTGPEDIDHYRIEWWRRSPLTLMETNRSRNRDDVYRVPDADKGKAHFPKVFAVDEDNNESAAAQPGDQNETGDFASEAPGTIKHFGGGATPTGWLRCNGDPYSTSLFPDLFAAVGYTYGGGGSSFLVPDFRRRHPRGVGTSQALGDNEGETETERSDHHGDHNDHRHKHKHRHGHRDHTQLKGGDTGDEGTGQHVHGIGTLHTQPSNNTVPRGTAATLAAGPLHAHEIQGETGGQGSKHVHKVKGSTESGGTDVLFSADAPTAATSWNGLPQSLNEHGDGATKPDGPADLFLDSLTGGSGYTAEPTDITGVAIRINEANAANGANKGHKKHGHLRVHFIIKT